MEDIEEDKPDWKGGAYGYEYALWEDHDDYKSVEWVACTDHDRPMETMFACGVAKTHEEAREAAWAACRNEMEG